MIFSLKNIFAHTTQRYKEEEGRARELNRKEYTLAGGDNGWMSDALGKQRKTRVSKVARTKNNPVKLHSLFKGALSNFT